VYPGSHGPRAAGGGRRLVGQAGSPPSASTAGGCATGHASLNVRC